MPDYIEVPIVTDPAALEQLAYDTFQAEYPGWAPADGGLDTIAIQAVARIGSVVANLVSAVPKSIARFIGPLFGVIPIDATPATVPTTWTMVDNTGHTIPAGTITGIRDGAGNLVAFQTLTDIVVQAGQTATGAGAVILEAVTPGAAGSGLGAPGGTVELVTFSPRSPRSCRPRSRPAASTPKPTTTTSTGSHERSCSPRGRSSRPTSPPAAERPGHRPGARDRRLQPRRQRGQTITVNATGGTYTLTFSGQTTAAIAYNANAAAVKAALEALSNIAPGDVSSPAAPARTARSPSSSRGVYAGTNVAQMTADAASLTGGTHTATVATSTGARPPTGQERTSPSPSSTRTATRRRRRDRRRPGAPRGEARGQLPRLRDRSRPTPAIDVSFTVEVDDGFDEADVVAAPRAVTSVPVAGELGAAATGDQRAWVDEPTVRYNDLAWVIRNVQGVAHVTDPPAGRPRRLARHQRRHADRAGRAADRRHDHRDGRVTVSPSSTARSADDLYEALAPLAGGDPATATRSPAFCARDRRDVRGGRSWYARDTDDGLAGRRLVDVDEHPTKALGWLAQFVGVTLDPASNEAAQRAADPCHRRVPARHRRRARRRRPPVPHRRHDRHRARARPRPVRAHRRHLRSRDTRLRPRRGGPAGAEAGRARSSTTSSRPARTGRRWSPTMRPGPTSSPPTRPGTTSSNN
jgi:hypothetical protein